MSDMRNFCTLFNYRYLTRGFALYESLLKNCNNFKLFVYCLDQETFDVLNSLRTESLIPISFSDVETERLSSVKSSRSFGEYCWTATPFVVIHALKTFDLTHCTYIDADTYFFNDPNLLFDEIGNHSVAITPHWYSPAYEDSKLRGKYCVQFNYFKNDVNGLNTLNWWADRCIEWCGSTPEDGKFGDQKYLDHWIEMFPSVHEITYRGGGVAPWNVQQYSVIEKDHLEIHAEHLNSTFILIYYHFHALDYIDSSTMTLGGYLLSEAQIKSIYEPYILHLERVKDFLSANFECFRKSQDKVPSFTKNFKRVVSNPYALVRYALKRYNMKKNIVKISDLYSSHRR